MPVIPIDRFAPIRAVLPIVPRGRASRRAHLRHQRVHAPGSSVRPPRAST
jgi:hypothetical protein